MHRTSCAGCGGALSIFADLGRTPLADVFPEKPEDPLPSYPLQAAACDSCGLAQLTEVVADSLLYGPDYGFRTGASPSSLQYMQDLAVYAHSRSQPGLAVEIGCNDGTLLSELQAHGRQVIGIDPSAAARDARDRGLHVMAEPFTASMVRNSGGLAGQTALVVAVNVAAHVADPHDFLEGIRLLLGSGGVAVVEFQYLPDLLAGCLFDLIYHEHRFFYGFDSFAALAEKHGLFPQTYMRTPAQGGSLRVTLVKAAGSDARYGGIAKMERGMMPDLLAGFQARANYARQRIGDVVAGYKGTMYGFAASAKSCTLLNWCYLGVQQLPYVVDTTPGKVGRFTPGSRIPIVGPGEVPDPDAYLLLASNYLGGILRREAKAGYEGDFIVPLPVPVIV